MTPLFSLDNVCFAYEGHIALRYITLDVARGETVVLQGSNGCGKSTLLKLLNGLVYAEEGTYRFDGDVIDEKSLKDNVFSKRFHQRVGFIFQNSDVQLFSSGWASSSRTPTSSCSAATWRRRSASAPGRWGSRKKR